MDDPLRAEHDALAERLRIRRSVDELRKVAYAGFAGVVASGLTVKFAWDRWGWSKLPRPAVRYRYPMLVLGALFLAAALTVFAVRAWRRARSLRLEEEALFVRFRELRSALRLDP